MGRSLYEVAKTLLLVLYLMFRGSTAHAITPRADVNGVAGQTLPRIFCHSQHTLSHTHQCLTP